MENPYLPFSSPTRTQVKIDGVHEIIFMFSVLLHKMHSGEWHGLCLGLPLSFSD